MLKKWKRTWQESRAQPGDGSALRQYRFWQLFSRSLYFVELADPSGRRHVYEIDVRHGADSTTRRRPASLYRDGVQVQQGNVPVAFAVPGGVIEVATSSYGVKRMHLVRDDGPDRVLTPHPRSQEGLRARFDRRFPRTSTAVGAVGMVVMLVGLVVTLAVAAESLTRVDEIAAWVGTFTSPVDLPGWAEVALPVAGALAGIDRALRLKSTWMA